MTASITKALSRSSRSGGIRILRNEPAQLGPDFLLGQLVKPVHQIKDVRQVVFADDAPAGEALKGGEKTQLQALHILKQFHTNHLSPAPETVALGRFAAPRGRARHGPRPSPAVPCPLPHTS